MSEFKMSIQKKSPRLRCSTICFFYRKNNGSFQFHVSSVKIMLSLSTFLPASNLILQATICLSLTVFLSFLNVPALLLYGLHTYVHPDDVTPNNDSSRGGMPFEDQVQLNLDSNSEKNGKKSMRFDENKAQIFRLKISDANLQTRIYFKQFGGVFNSTIVAISCLLLQKFLTVPEDCGILKNGSVIPVLLGFAGICRVFILIAKLSFELSASKKSEKLLTVLVRVVGFFWGLAIVAEMVPKWVIDFDFESLDGFGKLFIAIFMGCIVGFFYVPAMKNAHAFWLGTDQIRCNLSIISCGWLARMLLYANYFLVVFTSTLWTSPFVELLLDKKNDGTKGFHSIGRNRNAGELAGSVGMTQSDFDKFRFWCLLISGLLQIASLWPKCANVLE